MKSQNFVLNFKECFAIPTVTLVYGKQNCGQKLLLQESHRKFLGCLQGH